MAFMDRSLLQQFLIQLSLQCQFFLMAANMLNEGMAVKDVFIIFFAIQNLLTAAANISKALWGQTKNTRLAQARKPLRDAIGVSDSSPLRVVTMRNNYEHFDERLDEWWQKSKTHFCMDLNLLSSKAVTSASEPIDWFRVYDPVTTDLTFWGEAFNLKAIIDEVDLLLPKIKAALARQPSRP
jgi:hypothetical protein